MNATSKLPKVIYCTMITMFNIYSVKVNECILHCTGISASQDLASCKWCAAQRPCWGMLQYSFWASLLTCPDPMMKPGLPHCADGSIPSWKCLVGRNKQQLCKLCEKASRLPAVDGSPSLALTLRVWFSTTQRHVSRIIDHHHWPPLTIDNEI